MERNGSEEAFDKTRSREVAGASASYIDTDTPANPDEDTRTVEIVADESLLVAAEPLPLRANPVSAYLAGLAESSRRPMRGNLETIARLVSGGRVRATELAWWNLRYEHTSLIRSTLAASYAPATANLMLSAMRGVLKACFRLGYMSADDLQRASDVPPARGSCLPPGRAVERDELFALFRLCNEDDKRARGEGCGALRAALRVRAEEERGGLPRFGRLRPANA